LFGWKKGQDLGFVSMFTDGTESKQDTFSYIELGYLYLNLLLPFFTDNYVTRLKANLK